MNGQGIRGLVAQGLDGQKSLPAVVPMYCAGFTSGSGLTPPQSVPVRAFVWAIGGGAGGRSYVLGSGIADGGAGGGAAYGEFLLMPGQSLAYAVGAGGAGLSQAATPGGDTTVTSPSGRRLVAQGGQGRIGGRGDGGLRNYKGGDGGDYFAPGAGFLGAAGPDAGGEGLPGQGGNGALGGGGGGAASPGLPPGLLAAMFAPGGGVNGTDNGGLSAPLNFGGGGGGNTNGAGGAAHSGPGAGGVLVILMIEIRR